ncbi:leucine-rich repeat receptor-like serine/threonine/tyrosine-protein kinase SOBIR1 [Coffea arabica]|uniref:Leucine-rich repeat receptor-like serine/threonine/tyrosine-protein kinase SOBIR1 n=1 Tax=Coffea arabica TaxID=13443 RepID=A0A6P6VJA0_COFAR|nr:leucine-rich repeat receptor-like serine/threonine/tyrosine-protein kinase SOBIR1 [Coffea arabica]
MAFSRPRIQLSFLSFFSLIFIAQSKLELYPQGHEVVLAILEGMSSKGLDYAFVQSPCNFVGILTASLKCFPDSPKFSCANYYFSGKLICSQFLNIIWHRHLRTPMPESTIKNSKRYIFIENQMRRYQHPTRYIAQPPLQLTALAQPLKHHHKRMKIDGWIFWVGILVGGLAGLSFSIFLSSIMLRSIKEPKVVMERKGVTTFTRLIHPPELAFLQKEDNLASLGHFIGKGGCGDVYRVELPERGIAIKRIAEPHKTTRELTEEDSKLLDTKMRQIKQEIKTVGLARHRNLLPLLAHVSQANCHYLVYEYMRNGSLEDLIYRVSKGPEKLCWLSRHRIALGIAEGLKYMHTDITPRIIHRDLKPANILLDDDMEAKITDFGLSKAFPEINTHLMSNVAGTVGYMAPEYHETLMFSEKSDIYSFGVILAALVMGKLPKDDFFQHTEEMNMVKWMRNVAASSDPWRAIDPNLMGNGHENVLFFALKLACTCTSDEPNERPSSTDVSTMLASHFPHSGRR